MTTKTGRPTLFGPKDDPRTVRALALTKRGRVLFEQARTKLKTLANWPGTVSDGDVIESLARGEKETASYLRKK